MKTGKAFKAYILLLSLAFAAAPQQAAAATTSNWDTLSTVLALGIAGSAGLSTLTTPDAHGRVQLVKTFTGTFLATEALKAVIHERRPDGSDNDSFPSGHTAIAFAAASWFDIRNGAQHPVLVPVFYGAAVLTGVSRIKAHKHYFKDVAAGALLGWGIAHAFTTEKMTNVSVYPTNGGLVVSYSRRF